VTGVVLSNAGVDRVLQDTYYVVAHFPLCAVARRRVRDLRRLVLLVPEDVRLHVQRDRRQGALLGDLHRLNLVFFPQHFLGLSGMPRRYVDYPDAFAGWNLVSSIGSYISAFGVLIFIYGVIEAFARKRQAANNPWGPARPRWNGRCRRRRRSTSSRCCRGSSDRGAINGMSRCHHCTA